LTSLASNNIMPPKLAIVDDVGPVRLKRKAGDDPQVIHH